MKKLLWVAALSVFILGSGAAEALAADATQSRDAPAFDHSKVKGQRCEDCHRRNPQTGKMETKVGTAGN